MARNPPLRTSAAGRLVHAAATERAQRGIGYIWLPSDDEFLRAHAGVDMTHKQIGEALGRTKTAVSQRCIALRLPRADNGAPRAPKPPRPPKPRRPAIVAACGAEVAPGIIKSVVIELEAKQGGELLIHFK